jgi:hypothetical protein
MIRGMRTRYWIALGVVVLAVVAAGSAVAATKLESPDAHGQAVIKDAAGRLHVTPAALSAALKGALDDQVDAAVAAGHLTKSEGDALKAHIAAGPLPLGAPHGFGMHGHGFGMHGHGPGMLGPGVDAAASYLGITGAQLHSELAKGKSLAQIAEAHGKTAAGLVDALVASAKTRLDHAVADGHLTSAQEKAILARMHFFLERFVHHTLSAPMFGPPVRPGFGGAPGQKQPHARWHGGQKHQFAWS